MHDPKYTADEQDLINDFVAEELISDFSPERKNALMQLAAKNKPSGSDTEAKATIRSGLTKTCKNKLVK